jgi:hypothetical protein
MHLIEKPHKIRMRHSGEVLVTGYHDAHRAIEMGVATLIEVVEPEPHADNCTCGACRNARSSGSNYPADGGQPDNYPTSDGQLGSANYTPID